MVLHHSDVRRLLPHRHPMLLVDQVLAFDKWQSAVATKVVSASEPCYAGMEEDLPIAAYAYPFSLLMESAAQVGAVLWLRSAAMDGEPVEGTLVFGGGRDCKPMAPVYPGDTMRHIVRFERRIGPAVFMSAETWVGDRQVAQLGALHAAVTTSNQLVATE